MTQPRSHSKRVEEPGFEPSSAEPRIPALACQARFAPFSFLISGRGGVWNRDVLSWEPGLAKPLAEVCPAPPWWPVKTVLVAEKGCTAASSSISEKRMPV